MNEPACAPLTAKPLALHRISAVEAMIPAGPSAFFVRMVQAVATYIRQDVAVPPPNVPAGQQKRKWCSHVAPALELDTIWFGAVFDPDRTATVESLKNFPNQFRALPPQAPADNHIYRAVVILLPHLIGIKDKDFENFRLLLSKGKYLGAALMLGCDQLEMQEAPNSPSWVLPMLIVREMVEADRYFFLKDVDPLELALAKTIYERKFGLLPAHIAARVAAWIAATLAHSGISSNPIPIPSPTEGLAMTQREYREIFLGDEDTVNPRNLDDRLAEITHSQGPRGTGFRFNAYGQELRRLQLDLWRGDDPHAGRMRD